MSDANDRFPSVARPCNLISVCEFENTKNTYHYVIQDRSIRHGVYVFECVDKYCASSRATALKEYIWKLIKEEEN